jgi:murein DD-endopeptidase MepM/ murein hydrolase activator NlpD
VSEPATVVLVRSAVPHTIIPDRLRLKVITYTVRAGDTLLGIAEQFGLKADTIMWASGRLEDHPDLLHVGQVLTLLPLDGVYHTVQKGETLGGLAKKYKVDVEAIVQCEYNDLEEPYQLVTGQKLIVPGGKKPYVPRVVHAYAGGVPASATKGTGLFSWPVSGRSTQGYWDRHKAIDIGAPNGRAVLASDSGYVAEVGWSKYGYGNFLVIDHGNGFQTLYAHLSAVLVRAGQSVGKGARIGSVGSTGRSTGYHLHFEIRYKGAQRNPFGYLP